MPVIVKEATVGGKKRWQVVEKDSGKVVKTYSSRADAQAYATALNLAHARKMGYGVPKARR